MKLILHISLYQPCVEYDTQQGFEIHVILCTSSLYCAIIIIIIISGLPGLKRCCSCRVFLYYWRQMNFSERLDHMVSFKAAHDRRCCFVSAQRWTKYSSVSHASMLSRGYVFSHIWTECGSLGANKCSFSSLLWSWYWTEAWPLTRLTLPFMHMGVVVVVYMWKQQCNNTVVMRLTRTDLEKLNL